MFCMRLSHSGRGFHLAFANQAQEAFLEGHVEAFEHFGGVPVGQIRYDNLKPAVIKVLLGRDRTGEPPLRGPAEPLLLRQLLLPAGDRRGA